MSCRGICHRYKAKWIAREYRYLSGQKRCNVCSIFIEWEGMHCPCCGMSLRTRPRTGLYKTRLKMMQANKV
ncbi:MAG: hypothetical protein ACR2LL_11780 [Nitrosopumilus sp.]|uniref:hypothetical protein n=1 Tax=Nitrosopumilus sp. TaxID=2024843 RepID=UPI00292D2B83|nr:hypothetical protein [Nitrosopumilus sp.]